MPEAPRPVLLAMVICREARDNEYGVPIDLVGIFDSVYSSSFPFRYPVGYTVYTKITNAQGEYDFRLELAPVGQQKGLGSVEQHLTLPDRMITVAVTFEIPSDGVFPSPGRYEFRLFSNRRFVGSHPMLVVKASSAEEASAAVKEQWQKRD